MGKRKPRRRGVSATVVSETRNKTGDLDRVSSLAEVAVSASLAAAAAARRCRDYGRGLEADMKSSYDATKRLKGEKATIMGQIETTRTRTTEVEGQLQILEKKVTAKTFCGPPELYSSDTIETAVVTLTCVQQKLSQAICSRHQQPGTQSNGHAKLPVSQTHQLCSPEQLHPTSDSILDSQPIPANTDRDITLPSCLTEIGRECQVAFSELAEELTRVQGILSRLHSELHSLEGEVQQLQNELSAHHNTLEQATQKATLLSQTLSLLDDKIDDLSALTPSFLNEATTTVTQALHKALMLQALSTLHPQTSLSMGSLCIVCFENKREVRVHPCGHTVLCSLCAKHIAKCPACTKQIASKEPLRPKNQIFSS
ncbi:hypothetical protein Pelo_5791 [Pelomyxa schiedti]|nr:hypothetical protein Pelo_5791 [Pelomyxa schiedti]